MDSFIVTKEWIMSHQTDKGSWNARQLKCLGIDWPAKKGWINRMVGQDINPIMKGRFELLAGEPSKDKINVQDQERRIKQLEHQMSVVLANLNIVLAANERH